MQSSPSPKPSTSSLQIQKTLEAKFENVPLNEVTPRMVHLSVDLRPLKRGTAQLKHLLNTNKTIVHLTIKQSVCSKEEIKQILAGLENNANLRILDLEIEHD